ncbi:hypothetical protein FB451DRAFT_1385280 [Mycena latifolia]|nr:hypothetical protein FB451DRAFT_1385280 [Mycena latifolia]
MPLLRGMGGPRALEACVGVARDSWVVPWPAGFARSSPAGATLCHLPSSLFRRTVHALIVAGLPTRAEHGASRWLPVFILMLLNPSRAHIRNVYRTILLLKTPSALEAHFCTPHRAVTGCYREAHAYVQARVSRWINVENRVERASFVFSLYLLPQTSASTAARLHPPSLSSRTRFARTAACCPSASSPSRSASTPLRTCSRNVQAYLGDRKDPWPQLRA